MDKTLKKEQKRVRGAFTLLELLVVILILGLLAAFVVPNIRLDTISKLLGLTF
jgi:prepilin-type N-terminal cleavage/methylation domain-containing protein